MWFSSRSYTYAWLVWLLHSADVRVMCALVECGQAVSLSLAGMLPLRPGRRSLGTSSQLCRLQGGKAD